MVFRIHAVGLVAIMVVAGLATVPIATSTAAAIIPITGGSFSVIGGILAQEDGTLVAREFGGANSA
jgi:hypothetical protein